MKNPRVNRRKENLKIMAEINENENTTTQNLWDTVKAVLRGRVIALQAYLKKQKEKNQINKIRNENGKITTDNTKTQRIIRDCYQ